MKQTLTVNLNGIVFHIDDDAYHLLKDYLADVAAHLGDGADVAEIIADVEARIGEVFSEKLAAERKQVVTLAMVEHIMAMLGKPADYADGEVQAEPAAAKQRRRGSRRLYRDTDRAILGGVLAGASAYLGWDPIVLRVLVSVFTIFVWGSLFPVYLVVWLVAPAAKTMAQKLEMQGEAVTVENIKSGFESASEYVGSDDVRANKREVVNRLREVFVWIVRTCFTVVAVCMGIVGFVVLAALFVVLVVVLFGLGSMLTFLPALPFAAFLAGVASWQVVLCVVALVLLVALPVWALVSGAIKWLRGRERRSSRSNWVVLGLWLVSLVVLATLTFANWAALTEGMDDWRLAGPHSNIRWNSRVYMNPHGGGMHRGDRGGRSVETSVVDAFHSVDLWGAFDVEFVQGEGSTLVLEGAEYDVELVEYEVVDGVLRLSMPDTVGASTVNVRLVTDELRSFVGAGACSLVSDGVLTQADMTIDLSGASQVDLKMILSGGLDVKTSGASSLDLEGAAESLVLEVSGASKVDADDLRASRVDVDASGVSKVEVHAADVLSVVASGGSLVEYKGKPRIEREDLSGMSFLRKD